MNNSLRASTMFFIVLFIVTCSTFVVKNIKTNNKLVIAEQEILDARKEVNALTENLRAESNKNKNMEETIGYMEKTINYMEKVTNDLNLELSIANKKIAKMEETGVPVYFTEEEVNYIAKTVWGEARGVSKIQQSAVVWCILNRLEDGYWGNTIKRVITYPDQFHGYHSNYPVTDEIREVVEDVLMRWNMEKMGVKNVGRTLPKEFLYFHSDKTRLGNVFKTSYGNGDTWYWNCWNPYE